MKNGLATLTLSDAQRNLLLVHENEFDDKDLFRLIAVAFKKGDRYEIMLTPAQLSDLCEEVSCFACTKAHPQIADKLNDMGTYLEKCLEHLRDVFGSDHSSGHSADIDAVYEFKVALEGNAKIWRTIAICDNQTLDDLHSIIFEAFDRFDEHMYSFYIPHTPKKKRPRRIYDVSTEYKHPYSFQESDWHETESYNAATVTIGSLNLQPKQILYYLFDYGDCWWHTITVKKVDAAADNGKYPRIIESKGDSPDQYPDY